MQTLQGSTKISVQHSTTLQVDHSDDHMLVLWHLTEISPPLNMTGGLVALHDKEKKRGIPFVRMKRQEMSDCRK
jgi:hypothetical protein